MGKHDEWRKIAKKCRRKRLRQLKAKERDLKLEQEQERLETSPSYKTWIEEQERIENEREIEEKRQSLIREKQWREVEKQAQKQWQQLQKILAQAREEKIKNNMKIKMEWEQEQERLRKIQIAKEKELEEKKQLQQEREKLLLDFLEQGGDTPKYLKTPLETNPGRDICPFFLKVAACRFFDTCSRNHVRPGISNTILITNFFSHISLQTKENEHGSDSSLEFEKEDTYAYYVDFFNDVVSEMEKCGKIRNFFTCCNHESHLRGNVYVEYQTTRDALVSYHKFNGRWYDGRQLNIYFCNIESWKFAICGLYFRNKCPKGNSCNFLHVFKNPKNLYHNYVDDFYRKSKRNSSRTTNNKTVQEWDLDISDRKLLRWSESPERILENVESFDKTNKSRGDVTKSRHRDKKEKRHRSRERSTSRTRSNRKRKHKSRSRSRRRRD